MLAPLRTLEQILARLREVIDDLPLQRQRGYLSLALEWPHPLAVAPDIAGPRFQFSHNQRGELRAGYGIAGEWKAQGPGRLQSLRSAAKRMAAEWEQFDPDETGFSGFTMLGFAASPHPGEVAIGNTETPLPNAMLWLPELALSSRGGQSALVLSTALPTNRETLLTRWQRWLERVVPLLNAPALDPLMPCNLIPGESAPDRARWHDLVRSALRDIELDRLEKVVICRRLQLTGRRRFDLTRLNAALAYLFPSCQIVTIRRGTTSFVAATPERLLSQRRERAEVDAIAGTTYRAASSDQDAELTDALRSSRKNLHEHNVVVRAVIEALRLHSRQVLPPEEPEVMQLNNAQHLWSLVRAELRPGVDVFQLADALHPTPATNGQPCVEARHWLDRHERLQRGWYTGAAGIIDPDLTGELWVLLRCAQILDMTASLFAGAGIVSGSDADEEWLETEHKLAAMATALRFA